MGVVEVEVHHRVFQSHDRRARRDVQQTPLSLPDPSPQVLHEVGDEDLVVVQTEKRSWRWSATSRLKVGTLGRPRVSGTAPQGMVWTRTQTRRSTTESPVMVRLTTVRLTTTRRFRTTVTGIVKILVSRSSTNRLGRHRSGLLTSVDTTFGASGRMSPPFQTPRSTYQSSCR